MRKKIIISLSIVVVLFVVFIAMFFMGGSSNLSGNVAKTFFCREGQEIAKVDIGEETSSVACKTYCEEEYKEEGGDGYLEDGHCYCTFLCEKVK